MRYLTRANRLKQFACLNEITRRPFFNGHLEQFYRNIFLTTALKSIDVQLSSLSPKKSIVRECFQSIKNVLKEAGDSEGLSAVEAFLEK